MSRQDFHKEYPFKIKTALNKAIRAEMYGGDELLDLMELVSHMKRRGTQETKDKLSAIETHLHYIRDAMVEGVKESYEFDQDN